MEFHICAVLPHFCLILFGKEMDPNATLLLIGCAAAILTVILIARRWINSPSRKIDRYIEQLKAGEIPDIPERTEWDHEIALTSKGFTTIPLSNPSKSAVSVEWDSVVEATVFKRDLFSTDQVCIEFRLLDDSRVEVHEEMKGWSDLCDALPNYLPGAPPWTDWFMTITTPAFELNPTPLFRRDNPVSTP
jgi:hypothetical protein